MRLAIEEQPREELPLIYVASALSHLTESDRSKLKPWCDAVSEAAVNAALQDTPRWEVRTHVPFEWSAPWTGDGKTPAEVYRANMEKVRGAAALIVLGYHGGSLGAGQELAWATAARVPTLYLRPIDDPLSRQIEGTPADIVFVEFDTDDELSSAVVRFVQARRHPIEDHPRRLRDREIVFSPLFDAVEQAWGGLSVDDRQGVGGNARLHPRRAQELVAHPLNLAHASLSEILALTGALGIDPWRWFSGQTPELESRQLAGLQMAAEEFDWSAAETLDLYREARTELASEGTRRMRLETMQDWAQFRKARRGG
ncbi:MAG: hypothetical protein DCC49_02870 [Acidobacteria bacterium]|nr:MAG: hypothetical protein DCC49_02870 [Acidobacteriota bacterium]